jgi:hypothetical protein
VRAGFAQAAGDSGLVTSQQRMVAEESK